MSAARPPMPIVVLISGSGTNLQAILTSAAESPSFDVVGVISDQPHALGLQRARAAGVATYCIDRGAYRTRELFETALAHCIERLQPALIVMAGFMRVLSARFIGAFAGRMLNVHPSLLPRYRGLQTHRKALRAGEREHGASVHFVTAELDSGPVIMQARVPILDDDTEQRLRARVLEREHIILPLAIEWFANGRLAMRDGQVWLDGEELETPRMLEWSK